MVTEKALASPEDVSRSCWVTEVHTQTVLGHFPTVTPRVQNLGLVLHHPPYPANGKALHI